MALQIVNQNSSCLHFLYYDIICSSIVWDYPALMIFKIIYWTHLIDFSSLCTFYINWCSELSSYVRRSIVKGYLLNIWYFVRILFPTIYPVKPWIFSFSAYSLGRKHPRFLGSIVGYSPIKTPYILFIYFFAEICLGIQITTRPFIYTVG